MRTSWPRLAHSFFQAQAPRFGAAQLELEGTEARLGFGQANRDGIADGTLAVLEGQTREAAESACEPAGKIRALLCGLSATRGRVLLLLDA